ncbi:MAG TPA: DNA recombination protein RmuC [Candidatus Acidoferrales bacterium]|jgi:DNA recombination protein RmuC|nr:DNA recombination protein RmuC [Candidatus Acidoferrales bacterium]
MMLAAALAGFVILLVAAAVALAVWLVSRAESRTRQETQSAVSIQVQGITAQLGQLTQSVNQQLGQVREELQRGVSTSAQLANDARREVAQQMQSSTEAVRQISQQLGAVQKAGQDLSQAHQTLERVLSGAKTRGMLGEVALERLLADALPQAAYEIQFRFPNGNIVDAIVRSGDRILPVDSKFPLDAYRRLLDTGEDARKEFSTAVRKHADVIAEKYILPAEHTLDYALMFVPSEGVYYELLMTKDSKYGQLDEYCREKRVFPVSPNTLYAYLRAVAMSLQGQKIAENVRELRAGLEGLKRQLDSFAELYERLGNHLKNTRQNYEDAEIKLDRARSDLDQMAQGALPEPVPPLFETAKE